MNSLLWNVFCDSNKSLAKKHKNKVNEFLILLKQTLQDYYNYLSRQLKPIKPKKVFLRNLRLCSLAAIG